MARDLVLDFRTGGGGQFLYGEVTIQGSMPRTNGTATVLFETNIDIVGGVATLTSAQETDGTWHYHIIARDLITGNGATFRVFLPEGTGAINLADCPSAWAQVTT